MSASLRLAAAGIAAACGVILTPVTTASANPFTDDDHQSANNRENRGSNSQLNRRWNPRGEAGPRGELPDVWRDLADDLQKAADDFNQRIGDLPGFDGNVVKRMREFAGPWLSFFNSGCGDNNPCDRPPNSARRS